MLRSILIICSLICCVSVASAKIYRWEDANGVHLTDNPNIVPEQYREKVNIDVAPQAEKTSPKSNVGITKLNVPAITNQFQQPTNQTYQSQQRIISVPVTPIQPQSTATNKGRINQAIESAAKIMAVWIMFGVILFTVWLWAIVDIIRSEFTTPSDKTLWMVLVILIPFLGVLLYMILGHTQKSMSTRDRQQEELLARLHPRNKDNKDFVI